jgi:hypothetical protein
VLQHGRLLHSEQVVKADTLRRVRTLCLAWSVPAAGRPYGS